ncbi:hypothetical protein [Actinomadura madurae]|uniref:hypothetical protein n=1 Tax=Actinomadura madurae TaxID=1993 RepID=UPI0020D2611A|nr:hypothetical protein [Actinomadura madurae]MCQ0007491.1 hypothetical protein [Actinomadura madurae]MCQ0017205.1 hypothetical protein [Actinomadura madurae]
MARDAAAVAMAAAGRAEAAAAAIVARDAAGRTEAAEAVGMAAGAARMAAEAARSARMAADAVARAESAEAAGRATGEAEEVTRRAEKVARWPRKAVGVVSEAQVAAEVRVSAERAALALQKTKQVLFSTMVVGDRPQARAAAGAARPPGVLTRRLLAAGCALLPTGDQARYREEWLSLLTELPTRRARAGQVLSILRGAPRQAWTLRRPIKHVPPA